MQGTNRTVIVEIIVGRIPYLNLQELQKACITTYHVLTEPGPPQEKDARGPEKRMPFLHVVTYGFIQSPVTVGQPGSHVP